MRKMLRPIGAIENLFSAYGDLEAMTFAMVAEIELAIDAEELVEALAVLQRSHPNLQLSLGLDAAGHLGFFRCDAPLQLEFRQVAAFDLSAEIAAAMAAPFRLWQGPLMRVRALRSAAMTTLICVCHHAVADGKGALIILQQLIALLGEGLPVSDASSGTLDDLVGYTSPPLRWEAARGDAGSRSFSIAIDQLSPEVAERAFLAAKRHGVTFNSLLVAAVAEASAPESGAVPPRIMTPVDVRSVLDARADDGLFITIAITAREQGEGLWSHARRVGVESVAAREPDAVNGFVSSIGDRFAFARNYDEMRTNLVKHSPFDAIVTNLGIVDAGRDTDRIIGPIIKPFTGCEIIAVSTFAGTTTLIHSSVDDNEDLLERIVSVLSTIA